MNIIQSLLQLPVAERELVMRRAELALTFMVHDGAQTRVQEAFEAADGLLNSSLETFQEKKNAV